MVEGILLLFLGLTVACFYGKIKAPRLAKHYDLACSWGYRGIPYGVIGVKPLLVNPKTIATIIGIMGFIAKLIAWNKHIMWIIDVYKSDTLKNCTNKQRRMILADCHTKLSTTP